MHTRVLNGRNSWGGGGGPLITSNYTANRTNNNGARDSSRPGTQSSRIYEAIRAQAKLARSIERACIRAYGYVYTDFMFFLLFYFFFHGAGREITYRARLSQRKYEGG